MSNNIIDFNGDATLDLSKLPRGVAVETDPKTGKPTCIRIGKDGKSNYAFKMKDGTTYCCIEIPQSNGRMVEHPLVNSEIDDASDKFLTVLDQALSSGALDIPSKYDVILAVTPRSIQKQYVEGYIARYNGPESVQREEIAHNERETFNLSHDPKHAQRGAITIKEQRQGQALSTLNQSGTIVPEEDLANQVQRPQYENA